MVTGRAVPGAIVTRLKPFPGMRLYGGSKKAEIPFWQLFHEELRVKSFVGTASVGEHGFQVIVNQSNQQKPVWQDAGTAA